MTPRPPVETPTPRSRAALGLGRGSRAQLGFTLIELMVTITVAVVLLSTAVPSLRTFTSRNQVTASESAFMATLAFARTEAVRRGRTVFVVAASGGSTGNEFAGGWDVFGDVDGDGVLSSADLTSLRHYEAPPASTVVHGSAQITINASGYLSPAAAVTFKICQVTPGTTGYLVTMPPSGTPDVATLDVVASTDCTT